MISQSHTTNGAHPNSNTHTLDHQGSLDHAQPGDPSRPTLNPSSNSLFVPTTSTASSEHSLKLAQSSFNATATIIPTIINQPTWSIQSTTEARVQYMPRDVVQLIFEALLDTFNDRSTDELVAMPQRMRLPLLLGAVCRSWRAVAETTSTLWRTYVCRIDLDPGVGDDQINDERIQHYLARAGADTVGLALLLAIRGPRDGSFVARDSLAARMIPLFRRINHAIIAVAERARVEDTSVDNFLTILRDANVPLLRSMILHNAHGGLWTTSSSPGFFGGNLMSRVRNLTLNRVHVRVALGDIFRFDNLRILLIQNTFGLLDAAALKYILSAAPNLTTLDFRCHRIVPLHMLLAPGATIRAPAIQHPKLTNFHLSIDNLDPEAADAMRFDFPRLRYLVLSTFMAKACNCTVGSPPMPEPMATNQKLALLQAISCKSPGLDTVCINELVLDGRLAHALCTPGMRSLRVLECWNSEMFSTFWDALREGWRKSEFPALRSILCNGAIVPENESLKAYNSFMEAQQAEFQSPTFNRIAVTLSGVRFKIPQSVLNTYAAFTRFLADDPLPGLVPFKIVRVAGIGNSPRLRVLRIETRPDESTTSNPLLDNTAPDQKAEDAPQVDEPPQHPLHGLKNGPASVARIKEHVAVLEKRYPALQSMPLKVGDYQPDYTLLLQMEAQRQIAQLAAPGT